MKTIEIKTRSYMDRNPEENLSWCRPYRSNNGRVALAVNEGAICGLTIDGEDVDLTGMWRISEQAPLWERVCRASIDDADLLDIEARRYTWREIALMDGLVETGCSNCPYCDTCDAMLETMQVSGDEADRYDEDEIESVIDDPEA